MRTDIFLIIIIMVILVGCATRNPYYKLPLTDYPYIEKYLTSEPKASYTIRGGDPTRDNSIKIVLPDSLGGSQTTGDAVVQVFFDNKHIIKKIEFLGIVVNDSTNTTGSAFDRYHSALKRVYKGKIKPVLVPYTTYLTTIIEKSSFIRRNNDNDFAYVLILFER